MARFDELDEQAQQEWQARMAQKRLALSASVEETLEDSSLEVEEEFDEEDEQVVSPEKDTRSTTLIPPRLSLQSRQQPAVHAQSTSRSTKLLSDPHSEEECEPISVDNIHILARLTRKLAVVDGSISSTSTPYDSQNMPKIESVSSALPMTHKIPRLPHTQVIPASPIIPPPRPPDLTQVGADTPRTLKRTTKVRLQVVPKPGPPGDPGDRSSPLCDAPTDPSLPTVKPGEERAGTVAVSVAGSGSFESGQAEVAVANTSVTSSSVVVVVLTGDPGPVVVQYISLQPNVGFTVHLSAPTKNATPFNYRIL